MLFRSKALRSALWDGMGGVRPCVLLAIPARLLGPAHLGGLPLELRFQTLHLVFKAQLQFLQPHFFQFFVVGEVSLLGEGFKPLGVLLVLLSPSLELIMAGQELLSRSQHPC